MSARLVCPRKFEIEVEMKSISKRLETRVFTVLDSQWSVFEIITSLPIIFDRVMAMKLTGRRKQKSTLETESTSN
jgi:hypothetical protein